MRWVEICENLDDWEQEILDFVSNASLDVTWYHGTNQPFEKYNFGANTAMYFTTYRPAAESYANSRADKLGGKPQVITAKLKLLNPLYTIETNDYRWDIKDAKAGGHDSIVGPAFSAVMAPLNAIVFSKNQIHAF